MTAICVFCGSSPGRQPVYREDAYTLGTLLAAKHCELVWGAGSIGLMGAVADGVLSAQGKVWGAMPTFLASRELAHPETVESDNRLITPDMHTRKAAMAARADAFIALPGGFGTLDELFEILTWRKLSLHRKPVVLLNTAKFFDPLLALVTHLEAEGFIRTRHRALLQVAETPQQAIALATQP